MQRWKRGVQVRQEILALRREMAKRNLAAYIVPTEDFHGSEYVGDYFKARAYLSGFTGSAGTLLVLPDSAALWTDGRYFLQAEAQLSGSGIALMKSGEPEVPTLVEYLGKRLADGDRVGFDGRTVTGSFVEKLKKEAAGKDISFCGEEDLAGLVWKARPPLSAEPVWEHPLFLAGLSREDKLSKVREALKKQGADALLVTDLSQIAWLLNLRGADVRHVPVFLAYMLITENRAVLCAKKTIFSPEIQAALALAGVALSPYERIGEAIGALQAGQKLSVDVKKVSHSLLQAIPAGVQRLFGESPMELLKAVKTPEEIQGMRRAHEKDGVALARFLHWVKTQAGREQITETSAARKLEEFRGQMEGYLGPSFSPIVAYGANGAIVHYETGQGEDAALLPKGLLLADTGAHYREGTTDVTRTVALGELTEKERRAFTLALKGHLRLGAVKFPEGACGQNLDAVARAPLWEQGFDYNHGTGHGVGCLLSVHEGPQGIRFKLDQDSSFVPLKEGMIVSNEPGLYVTGKFGVRHENLELVIKGEKTDWGQFLFFESLTLAPFDRDALELSLMNEEEIALLNAYHKKVWEALSPHLAGEEFAWLREATAALSTQKANK